MKKSEIAACQKMDSGEAGLLVQEHAAAFHQMKKKKSKMDQLIARVKDKFAPDLKALKKTVDNLTERLCVWAMAHRDMFEEKRTVQFHHGRLRLEKNPWAVKTADDKTDDDVVAALETKAWGEKYLRRGATTLNREAMLADRENAEVAKALEDCGIVFAQGETFDVIPNEEPDAEG